MSALLRISGSVTASPTRTGRHPEHRPASKSGGLRRLPVHCFKNAVPESQERQGRDRADQHHSGQKFVLSFQEGFKGDVFDYVRERIRNGKGKIRALGADYLPIPDRCVSMATSPYLETGEDIEVIEGILS